MRNRPRIQRLRSAIVGAVVTLGDPLDATLYLLKVFEGAVRGTRADR